MLDPLYKAIGFLLAAFYSVVPNPRYGLGIAIILLTCTVMLVLFPLTAKQARSMIAMQRVQPEIKKIQQKFKDDRQKQNEEIMRFYQENKINPLAGCLPLLVQMPIYISLFRVLRNPKGNVPTSGPLGKLFSDICGSGVDTSAACKHPVGLHFLGMDLSVAAAKAREVTSGFGGTLPYFVLVGLVFLTGWYQTRQTMSRQANAAPNAQMQIIGKVMPVMFGVFSLQFASGLVLYFVTSNTWRIGQQHFVLNKYYAAAQAIGGDATAGDARSKEPAAPEEDQVLPPAKGRGAGAGERSRGQAGGQARGASSGARRKKRRKR